MRIFLLLIGISIALSAQAEAVYKSVDEDGNVIYTDAPTSDAEKIQLKNVQPIETAPVETTESSPVQEPQEKTYTKLEITSPKEGDSIYDNSGIINISLSVVPALRAREGDKLILHMDGQQIDESKRNQFNLNGIEPGRHSFVAIIINKEEKELKRSTPVTLTLYRHRGRGGARR
jgi:hypothetical protein